MLKSLKKRTLYILIAICSIIIVGVALMLYTKKMEIVSGGLNINKGVVVDKLCNYTIYNDFYYHIINNSVEADGLRKDLAKLTPVQTTICYDNKEKQVVLQPKIGDKVILEDNEGIGLANVRSMLEVFAETYALIAATQDPTYFQESYKQYQTMMASLHLEESELVKPIEDIKAKYYTTLHDLPIHNMQVQYFHLDKITEPPLQARKGEGWQPNIITWQFNEKDKIYLQYLKKWHSNTLDTYRQSRFQEGWHTFVKLPKFFNNKVSNTFLRFDKDENKVITLFMDSNGYVYNLIMKTQNPQAIQDYFQDYLKIAYGIGFVQQTGAFDASFQNELGKVEIFYESIKNYMQVVQGKYDELGECKGYNFLAPLAEGFQQEWLDIQLLDMENFDVRYQMFKEKYGAYPNADIERGLQEKFSEFQAKIKLVQKAIDKIEGTNSIFKAEDINSFFSKLKKVATSNSCEQLMEQCNVVDPSALECVQKVAEEGEK